ncbi:hypothetical protein DSO57_1033647 [Entomophthora muscae]|uniref:Uncharacterized protein n=1 Tax=Entomophthora muscae TaxID=34485 RepID=A0ACC2S2F0_9FUNG|nr:hypothetical protein DSO57_1033647 [Entomophthora muscae]
MKLIIPFICTALASAFPRLPQVTSIEELCNRNATVFYVIPYSQSGNPNGVSLQTESDVKTCKKMSGAKIFGSVHFYRQIYNSKKLQFKDVNKLVDNIHTLYEHEDSKFYDGFEFIIDKLNETMVERLLKERRSGQMFSLRVFLDRWDKLESVIRKYTANIDHIVLDIFSERDVTALKEVIQRNPKITFSVMFVVEGLGAEGVAKDVATSLSRKVGHTVNVLSPASTPLAYTAGI